MRLGVFVLHLCRAKARRKNANTLLETCKAIGAFSNYYIWPAVDGASMSEKDRLKYVGVKLFAPEYPFGLNHGEVGAFLSHRQIWEAIVDKGLDAALILEDDLATNVDRFIPAVSLALKHALDLGYVKMGEHPGKGETSVIDRAGVVYLSQSIEPGLGATGQVVSREAARILIEKSPVFDRPVDTFVQSHWFTGLRPANVHPAGLQHIDQELGGTTIQVKHKKWLPKTQRELLRFHYRRGVRRFSQNSSAPFRIAH